MVCVPWVPGELAHHLSSFKRGLDSNKALPFLQTGVAQQARASTRCLTPAAAPAGTWLCCSVLGWAGPCCVLCAVFLARPGPGQFHQYGLVAAAPCGLGSLRGSRRVWMRRCLPPHPRVLGGDASPRATGAGHRSLRAPWALSPGCSVP